MANRKYRKYKNFQKKQKGHHVVYRTGSSYSKKQSRGSMFNGNNKQFRDHLKEIKHENVP